MIAPWLLVLVGILSAGHLTDASDRENSTCANCLAEPEYVKMLRVNEVKNTILEKLRLRTVPNITSADLEHLPPIEKLISDLGFVSDMYADQPQEEVGENTYYEEDRFHVRPEQAAIFPDIEVKSKYVEISNWVLPDNLFQFKLSPSVLTRKLRTAFLEFHLPCDVTEDLKSFTVVVEKVIRDQDGYRTKKGGAAEVRNHRCPHDGRWIQIDVKKELGGWFSSLGEDNHGLKIRFYDHEGAEVNLKLPLIGKQRPFLKLTLGDDGKIRKRRYTGLNCNHTVNWKECCRYPFEINFLTFGWSWIIAPRVYNAYYCHGECRIPLNARQHMFYIQPDKKMFFNKSYEPCCTPKSLHSINMLYMDDSNTILHGLIPGMVVDTCSCLG